MKIAIAIPCYNCELQIGRLLSELDSVLKGLTLVHEVYIIENNSADNTLNQILAEVAKLANKDKFSVYQNLKNIGLGGSHKVAFTLAKQKKMSHVLILHGDHQASVFDIPVLLEHLIEKNGITTLGSRFQDLKNLSGYSHVRKFGNLVLNFIYSVVTRNKISDLGSGLNLFRLDDLDPKIYQSFDNGFIFNMDLLLHVVKAKIEYQYVPIKWSTTDQISNAKAFSVGIKTLKKLFDWMFSIKVQNENHFETKKIY